MEWAIERLISLIPMISGISKDNREMADAALRALSIALDETSIYVNGRKKGLAPNPELEGQLAKYWSAAAIPVRHFDEELCLICSEKNEFWLDPEGWYEHNKGSEKISLVNVRKDYRRLLARKYKSR